MLEILDNGIKPFCIFCYASAAKGSSIKTLRQIVRWIQKQQPNGLDGKQRCDPQAIAQGNTLREIRNPFFDAK